MSPDLPMREIRRLLSWVKFLEPLPDEALEDLVERADFVRLEEGEKLVLGPEEQAERMLILVAGQAQVYLVSPSGRELTLSVLDGGSVVGATGLVARWTRDLHVKALEPSLVCRVGHGHLEALMRQNAEVAVRLAGMLAGRLIWMEDRWADLVEKEVPARLASVLLMLVESEGIMTPDGPTIPTHYTHRQLASMIGANREAVTRAFAELRTGGGIRVRRRQVYVADQEALRRYAKE